MSSALSPLAAPSVTTAPAATEATPPTPGPSPLAPLGVGIAVPLTVLPGGVVNEPYTPLASISTPVPGSSGGGEGPPGPPGPEGPPGPPGPQTPWLSNINAAGHDLLSAGYINASSFQAMPGGGLTWVDGEWTVYHNASDPYLYIRDIVNNRQAIIISPIAGGSGGVVGINNIWPAYTLDVSGDCNISGTYRVNGIPLGQTPWLSNIDGAGFVLNNAGGIGIGAAAPTWANLLIRNENNNVGILLQSTPASANNNNVIQFRDAFNSAIWVFGLDTEQTGSQDLSIFSGGLSYITCRLGTGFVGIGTATPGVMLDVNGSIQGTTLHSTTPTGTGALMQLTQTGIAGWSFINVATSGRLDIEVGAGPAALTILPAGQVGIGTTTPAYKLDVAGDVNISAGSVYRINGVPIGITQQSVTANSFNTVYQNTTGKPKQVNVQTGTGVMAAFTDSANPPTTKVAGATANITITFLVLPGNFYEVTCAVVPPTFWIEWD